MSSCFKGAYCPHHHMHIFRILVVGLGTIALGSEWKQYHYYLLFLSDYSTE